MFYKSRDQVKLLNIPKYIRIKTRYVRIEMEYKNVVFNIKCDVYELSTK